jgi:plastocyanin
MSRKHTIAAVVFVIALIAAGGASSAVSAKSASVVIRHQLHGCHSWSVNGGAFKASQAITLQRGGTITVRNLDVMPHKLVETSGPALTITRISAGSGMGLKGAFPPAMLGRMGSTAKLTFAKPGVYRLTTKPGEDYMKGIQTVGEDNVLRLTVTVA